MLTMGTRPEELSAALRSVEEHTEAPIIVIGNGGPTPSVHASITARVLTENLGVPGGRDLAVRESTADIVVFLDDDAVFLGTDADRIQSAFASDTSLGALAFRLVDEQGQSARRHVPRRGAQGADRGGLVAAFLGGACAIRRDAYLEVGGYWTELWYGHEELDLSWRLIDAGYGVLYEPTVRVFHPKTAIGRHPEGWRLTGRNRVWIARRNLPRAVMVAHTLNWLIIGSYRASRVGCTRAYLAGWWDGWKGGVPRRSITWRTVVALTRLGRCPIV